MSGLANIFSTIDSIKRVLGSAAADPLEFLKSAGASAQASPLTVDQAAAFGPGAIGKILFHGGPQAVTRINPELGQNLSKGPGFYLSNILNTPLNFATNSGKRSGVISAFDLPDADYARMLRLNDKPLTKYPELDPQITKLMQDIPELRAAAIDRIKYIKGASPDTPTDSIITGDWLDRTMNKMFGLKGAPVELGAAGIPGKTWQYSAERPAEMASVVFPGYSDLLTPVAQLSVEPGIAGARAANMAMRALLGITK
jgi:hypothetical protein